MTAIDRRTLLKGALGGAALLSFGRASIAEGLKATVTRLTDKLSLISGVGGNVVALSTDGGIVLVDSGSPAGSDALREAVRSLPGGDRVWTLFNTHWHREQTGSNAVFGASGADIIAHEKTRLWLSTDHWLPTEDRYEKAWPKEAVPTQSFYTQGSLQAGRETIEYGYLLQAHTAGDIYVYFRDANVLVVGDAASPEQDPILDWFAGGWMGGRIDALSLLLRLSDDSTRIIAGTGGVIGREELQIEHEMLSAIFSRMTELMRKGYTTQAMYEAGVTQDLPRALRNPQRFIYDAHKSIWAHHNTLSHDIV
jgi:glyoxylase-like metal-dependent hydrolase (beta-lactamase superfamily II)